MISPLCPQDCAVPDCGAVCRKVNDQDSPSTNPCMIRLPSLRNRYRNDPYNAPVLPPILPQAPSSRPPSPQCSLRRFPPHMGELLMQQDCMKAKKVPLLEGEAAPTRYVYVHFKRGTSAFLCNLSVFPQTYVVVEGDRGENIGVVMRITAKRPRFPVVAHILRIASEEEMELLKKQRAREEYACQLAQDIVNGLRLPMCIKEAEFQFDQSKLTLWFTSTEPVDFRRLQRRLFQVFQCRIWLSDYLQNKCTLPPWDVTKRGP